MVASLIERSYNSNIDRVAALDLALHWTVSRSRRNDRKHDVAAETFYAAGGGTMDDLKKNRTAVAAYIAACEPKVRKILRKVRTTILKSSATACPRSRWTARSSMWVRSADTWVCTRRCTMRS